MITQGGEIVIGGSVTVAVGESVGVSVNVHSIVGLGESLQVGEDVGVPVFSPVSVPVGVCVSLGKSGGKSVPVGLAVSVPVDVGIKRSEAVDVSVSVSDPWRMFCTGDEMPLSRTQANAAAMAMPPPRFIKSPFRLWRAGGRRADHPSIGLPASSLACT
jgi:hypothetical protein